MNLKQRDFPIRGPKNILVTGGNGFIGSFLIPELLKHDFKIFSVQMRSSAASDIGSLGFTPVVCDLRNNLAVKKLIKKICPQAVIHLAAMSSVGYSYAHPQEVIQSNLIGTVNLAEACLHELPELEHFLFASTCETYGNGPNPKNEETPLNPINPYAISKVASENYLLYLNNAHNFPVTVLRHFNTYGRKRKLNYIVERAISQMINKSEIRLGNPDSIRDFMFIADHVSSYLFCLCNDDAVGEIFNFCTGVGISIKELVELISDIMGFKGKISWNTVPKRPLDIPVLIGNNSKAEKKLGWVPKYTLQDGLKLTIQSLKQIHNN